MMGKHSRRHDYSAKLNLENKPLNGKEKKEELCNGMMFVLLASFWEDLMHF